MSSDSTDVEMSSVGERAIDIYARSDDGLFDPRDFNDPSSPSGGMRTSDLPKLDPEEVTLSDDVLTGPHDTNEFTLYERVDHSDASHLPLSLPLSAPDENFAPIDITKRPSILTFTDRFRKYYVDNNMWLFLTLLSIAGGLSGFANEVMIKYMLMFRTWIMDSLTANEAAMGIHFLVWFSYIVGCSLVAMTFVFFSPASAAEGSGVAHVKALLHHWVFTPELFSLKTYLIKLVGLSFSVGCGLWLGKVDVHISVILTVLLLKLPLFKNINESEEDRYQMLVCGSCVGLSVNFGVPVSAVLFGLELCGSYYRSRIYMKAIFVSTFSAFFARWLSATLAGKDHLTVWLNVKIASPGWKYNEIPAFLILGALCGLLGTLFVVWNEQMIKIKKLVGTKKIIFLEFKYIWGLIMVMIIAVVTFPGFLGQYMSLSSASAIEDLGQPDMGNALLTKAKDWVDPNNGAKLFIHLIIFTVVRYIMSTLLVTCPLPGGPYTPFLVIGAGFGRLYAETLVAWFPEWGLDVQTNAYPLVAAAALTAGATHQRFSSAVLVLEITGVTMMFPLLICVTISSWIANQLWVPLADSIIRMRGWTSYNELAMFQNTSVGDVMVKNPPFLPEVCKASEIDRILDEDPQSLEFPIVDSAQGMHLIGVVERSYLVDIQNKRQKRKKLASESRDDLTLGIRRRWESNSELEVEGTEPMVTMEELRSVPITLHEHIPLVSLHACVVLTRLTTVYIIRRGILVGVLPIHLLKQYCKN